MKRRSILKSTLAGTGVLAANEDWSLNRLEPIGDTLDEEYPYRDWEDLYRREFTWDKSGKSSHCVNCGGGCAFDVYVKDGIVLREEQLAKYPQINPNVPDTNPRGCQMGTIHSAAMYGGDRLRYPLKRIGERGEGKWQRVSWDEITEEIADKVIDIFEKHGPGKLMTHKGTGNGSLVRRAAPERFASLLGGVRLDNFTAVGDLMTGAHLAYGNPAESFTTDAWFDADYIMLTCFNPNVTRMPDAHYIWEAKYNGAHVVSVSPNYNPSSIHADLWMPIKQGTDPFLAMAFVNVIIEENIFKPDFMKEQTDLPVLVRADNGKMLREADLKEGGSDEIFYHWDLILGKAIPLKGTMGSEAKTITLDGVEPALNGTFEVGGIVVTTVFEKVREEASKFTPEATAEITGIAAETVRAEARAFANAKKAILMVGFGAAKYSNGIFTVWAQALMLALTGHGGKTGGLDTTNTFWDVYGLSDYGIQKEARLEPGGLAEFQRGGMIEHARKHFDNAKLKERTGFDLDDMEAMINESISEGWMPYYGDVKGLISSGDNMFRRNKFSNKYRERMLHQIEELFVDINTRIDSTAQWADYLLPAASHYEAWDLRVVGCHRYVSVFDRPVEPIGEAKPDWEIMVLLSRKIQERAIARGVGPYPDGDVSRDLHTIYDDFTVGGTLLTDYDATKWIVDNTAGFGGVSLEEGSERGFFAMTDACGINQPIPTSEPYNPFVAQTEDKKPYETLTGRITFYCDHPRFLKLGAATPTARHHAGREASQYPLAYFSPHTRWGIHSNWRSNKFMMRLQRGEPNIYINPKLAAEKGISDGSRVRVFNSVGEFFAQAKFYPSLPETSIMMEHGWEAHQYEQNMPMNNTVATLIQPLDLCGGWGHLGFKMGKYNANQLAHESSVDIESA